MEHVRSAYPLHYLFFPDPPGKDKNNMTGTNNSNLVHMYRTGRGSARIHTTVSPQCTSTGERRCEDGTCISRVELCPEEQLMNQNTILIMIVVGLAVVIFLVILYCFQQRQQRASNALGTDTALSEDCDNASLYAPPPTYEDVMSSDLYLPTAEYRQLQLLSSSDEPLTPPPNYDTALILLAQSQDSALNKPRRQSSIFRRSVSMENSNEDETHNRNSISQHSENKNSKNDKKKQIFRYSGHFTRTGISSGNNPSSPRSFQRTSLPLYSPPMYPVTPPPPITPLLMPTSVHTQVIMPDSVQPTIPETPNEREVI